MYLLLIKQFFRTKTVLLALGLLLVLGVLSMGIGQQFLAQKQAVIAKTMEQQQKHIATQTHLHKDDLGLLLYYLKFSFINDLNPLAGIAIGQSDLNSHVQNVTILNLEGQKYDTDLVNPMRLHVGNMDVSFLLIFLFPLVIIALNFNILSEEVAQGTWEMIRIQGASPFQFLLKKLSIRLLFVSVVLGLLFAGAQFMLSIPFTSHFIHMITLSYLYMLFWFALCFFVIVLQQSSSTNAIVLLTSWLVLVVFLPVVVNNYIANAYPIEDAFTMTIKQRDAYHQKWDTDKKETIEKFYHHYPQFTKYGIKEEGFSWLWYYAMQQMGDDESLQEREAMYEKIQKRARLSAKIAKFFPPLQMQLSMNAIAQTSLTHHIDFLKATSAFHEDLRLQFYPKIFEEKQVNSVHWEDYKPEFFSPQNNLIFFENTFYMLLITLFLIGFGVFKYFSIMKHS